MAKAAKIKIKLLSTADTGYFYVTKKNARTKTEKLSFKKYDPVARKHVEFKETKIKQSGMPGGALEPLFGFRGIGAARLWQGFTARAKKISHQEKSGQFETVPYFGWGWGFCAPAQEKGGQGQKPR